MQSLLGFGVGVVVCSCVYGQHGGDVVLDLDKAGAIRTNRVGADGGPPEPARVFASEFGEVFKNFADEPGFDSAPGTFPVPSANGFILRRALRAWDGTAFSTIPAERVEVGFGPLDEVSTPIDDVPVTGFTLGVGSNGQWHRHLEFTLTAPASPGVYLLEMSLFSTDPAVAESAPFWVVFNQGQPEDVHDAAVDWAMRNLPHDVCESDVNADGVVDSRDFFEFLAAFFASDGDFNEDGLTDSRDFFDFLAAFFAPCDH